MRAVRNFLKGCNSCPEFLPARLASEPCTPLKPSFQPQLYNSWSALRDLHVRPGRASPSPTSPHSLQLHTQEMYAHSSGLVKLKGFQVTRPGLINHPCPPAGASTTNPDRMCGEQRLASMRCLPQLFSAVLLPLLLLSSSSSLFSF